MEAQVPKRRFSWISLAILLFFGGIVLSLIVVPNRGHRANSQLESLNNLKNLALAIHNLCAANNNTLPRPASHTPPLSWRVETLHLLDHTALGRQFQSNAAWDDPVNAEVSRTWLKIFQSPVANRSLGGQRKFMNPSGWPRCDYGMVSGPGTVNPDDQTVTLEDISSGDGLSQTLLIVECSGLQLAWAEPRDPRVDRERMGIDLLSKAQPDSNALISTWSRTGPPVAFADGSARTLSPRVDPQLLRALCTIDGDEPVRAGDYER